MIHKPSLQPSRSAVGGASRLLAATLLAVAPVSAATILNPSFESPDVGPPFSVTSITSWTSVGGSNPGLFDDGSGYFGTDGKQFLDITGNADTYGRGVSQGSITVIPGTQYTLNFDVGSFRYSGVDLGRAAVALTIGGGHTYTGNFVNNLTRPVANGLVWQTMAYSFTPTTPTISLQFLGVNVVPSSSTGIGLDNIKLTPVPEPAGVGTLLVGMGMFGFAARRRRSQPTA